MNKNLIKPLPLDPKLPKLVRQRIKEALKPGATRIDISIGMDGDRGMAVATTALAAGWKVVKVEKADAYADRHYFVTDTVTLEWVGG
jgi:hypothetical protein